MIPPNDDMALNKKMNEASIIYPTAEQIAQQKLEADKLAAVARLEQYEREQGLVSSEKNIREIRNFIESSSSLDERLRGKWTPISVDLAVRYLAKDGKLEFRRKATPAQPAAPAEPQEVLGKLPDGSTQLSLSKPCPHNATVEQAKDYLRRVRKQQQPQAVVVDGFKSALV
jgi:hypothetical protein